MDAKIHQLQPPAPVSPPAEKRRPHLEVQILRITLLRDLQIRKLEKTHELFEGFEAYIHEALRRIEQLQTRGNAQASKLKRLNSELHAFTRAAPLIRPTFDGDRSGPFQDSGPEDNDDDEGGSNRASAADEDNAEDASMGDAAQTSDADGTLPPHPPIDLPNPPEGASASSSSSPRQGSPQLPSMAEGLAKR
jgi:hypothetical protein